jgi:hypothetical protein
MSQRLLDQLANLRAWAAESGSLVYVYAPKMRPRFLLFKDQIDACPTDEALYAYLCERIEGRED